MGALVQTATLEKPLHNASLRIDFNPLNRKQVDDAKKKYIQAKSDNRKILSPDRVPIPSFVHAIRDGGFIIDETETSETEMAMHFIDDTGDRRVIWNMNDPAQVKEAAKNFKDYVAKGWKPYAIDRKGKRGMRIFSFNAEAQEIIFEDKTTVEKLANFVKKFKEIKMMPKTMPG